MSATARVEPVTTPSLSELTDDQVQVLSIALQLACGRAKPISKGRRRQWYCFLFHVLQVEADLRGLPTRPPTVHASELPPFAL